jgi:hypothetical protein
VPGLFVMWDKSIVRSPATADFSAEMHHLAVWLIQDSPYRSAQELAQRMQQDLGFAVRKTLAKYLDEFNLCEMVGAGCVARSG